VAKERAALVCLIAQLRPRVEFAHGVIGNELESDSLPRIRKYSKHADLLAQDLGNKDGGDGRVKSEVV